MGFGTSSTQFSENVTINAGSKLYTFDETLIGKGLTVKEGAEVTMYAGTIINNLNVQGGTVMLKVSTCSLLGNTALAGNTKIDTALAGNTKIGTGGTVEVITGSLLNTVLAFQDDEGKADSTGKLVFFGGSAIDNTTYVTKDEDGVLTPINYNTTGSSIGTAIEDGQVFFGNYSNIKGNGTISLETRGDVSDVSVGTNGFLQVFLETTGSEFVGTTEVKTSSMVLTSWREQQAIYGSKSGDAENKFLVYCESRKKNEDNEILSSGQLGFYNLYASKENEAVLTAGTVHFGESVSDSNATRTGGARLWLSTRRWNAEKKSDITNPRTLGTINANEIVFDDDTTVWYDSVSMLTSDAKMTFNLDAPDIKVVKAGTSESSEKTLKDVFSTALISAEVESTANGTDVISTANTVGAFAQAEKMTSSEKEVANQIDDNRMVGGEDGKHYFFYDALYNERDTSKVRQTLHNIARGSGIENMSMMTGHLGSVGSAFFNGGGMTSMAGTTTRGQEENTPEATPAEPGTANQQVISNQPSGNPRKWTSWVSFSHTSINGSEYDDDGMHFDAYKVRRSGVLTGIREQCSDTFSAGVLFAYSGPQLSQQGVLEGYESWEDGGYASEIDMDDFQFALHFEKLLGRNWELSVFIGGGVQSMDWQRQMYESGATNTYIGDTEGNTFTATAYLTKRMQMTHNFAVNATLGLDSEHNWMDAFSETGEGNAASTLASNMAYNYDDIEYHRNTLRIGLTGAYTGNAGYFGLTGRIFYGCQLGGDDAATVHAWNDVYKEGWDFQGSAMGRDSLNLGVGLYRYLNCAKTLSLSADYNAVLYEHATTNNITAGLQWRF